VYRVAPDGKPELILEDVVPGHVDRVETARAEGKFDREHFYARSGQAVEALTSVAFGGPDLRTLYVTSASKGRSNDELAKYPHSGKVLAFAVDVPGVEQAEYRG
jgi:hypothetical protein